jgi:NADH dehydrogenase FAD-containing subunit
MSKPAAAQVQAQLESLGVTVLLNEKAKPDDTNKNKLTLSSSNTIIDDADMIIWTTGFVPVNGLLRESLPEALDERGWIQTDEYFRIEGSDGHLFAIGDCTTTLPNAGNQVMRNIDVLGNNIHVTLTSKDVDTASLKKVSHGLEAYCNTTGPNQGVFECPLFWTRRVLPWVKNSTMFFMSPKDMLGLGSSVGR